MWPQRVMPILVTYSAAIFSSISFFKDPTLDISIVVSATAVLMAAGVIAGYIPARRAARVKTIDALRDSL